MQYKVLTFKDSRRGRKSLEKDVNKLVKAGWRIQNQQNQNGNYGIAKTAILGAVFLPLALAGRKKGRITITLEKES